MNPAERIADFVIERAAQETVSVRARLYHDLASFVPDEKLAAQLGELGDALEAIENESAQMQLAFRTDRKGRRS